MKDKKRAGKPKIFVYFDSLAHRGGKNGAWIAQIKKPKMYDCGGDKKEAIRALLVSLKADGRSDDLSNYEVVETTFDKV